MSSRRLYTAWCLLASFVPTNLHAQDTGAIRGRVTDAASGQPIADARVAVQGTSLSVGTRANGEYLFAVVPTGHRALTARRVGYAMARREVDVVAGDTAALDFVLNATAVGLDVVVVTGTAAPTETRALGNSIATVDGATVAQSQAVTVDGALQGKVAGMQITQNSGNPGGGGFSVRLRGTSSIISGSEPLYIVDGVIVDNSSEQLIDLGARSNVQNRLADLNPNDIERIEVIRGAAAAALYGSRANNGVIQIFTKRGRAGAPQFTWHTRYGESRLARRLRMNMYPTDAAGVPVTRYDYQDFIFSRGDVVENTLSVEGGNDQTTYYLGGSWSEEDGIVRNSGSGRKSARVNLTQQLYPTLQLTATANYINTHNDFEPNGEQVSGVVTALVFTPTTQSYLPANGAYPLAPLGASGFANPLNVIDNFKEPQDVNRFLGSLRIQWTPRADVALSYTLGYDGYQMQAGQFIPRDAYPTSYLLNPGFAASILRDSRIINSDGVVTWTKRIGDGVELRTSGGVNATTQRISTVTAASRDLLPISELVSAGAIPAAAQSRFELVTLGYYAQTMVSWRDRLYITGALRWDASSTFGPSERWQGFPKLSASYVLSEEPWFRGGAVGRLWSSLRLRAALGYAGNQPSTANAYSRYDSYGKAVNSGRVGVVNSVTLGNEFLKPERQREFEAGADMGFFKDRVSLEATYYHKLVRDLLLFRPLPVSTGYTVKFENIGEMSNKGIELALRSINLGTSRLRWATTLTASHNRNKVEKLVVAPFRSATGYPNRVMEGEAPGIFYGEYYLRNADGSIQIDSIGRPRRSLSLANAALREKKIGDPYPDLIASLLNEVQVGRHLQIRVLLDGTFGNDVMNLTRRIQDIFRTGSESERELLPFGDPRKLPSTYLPGRGPIFEEYVEDGSFVKLREIAVTYRLQDAWARSLRARSIEVTLAGRNLKTWTSYRGYDPELNLFGQQTVDRGFDFATYPIPRTWTVGVRAVY